MTENQKLQSSAGKTKKLHPRPLESDKACIGGACNLHQQRGTVKSLSYTRHKTCLPKHGGVCLLVSPCWARTHLSLLKCLTRFFDYSRRIITSISQCSYQINALQFQIDQQAFIHSHHAYDQTTQTTSIRAREFLRSTVTSYIPNLDEHFSTSLLSLKLGARFSIDKCQPPSKFQISLIIWCTKYVQSCRQVSTPREQKSYSLYPYTPQIVPKGKSLHLRLNTPIDPYQAQTKPKPLLFIIIYFLLL